MQQPFEFDEAKSRANKAKHGIDFFEAQDLWLDGDLLRLPARSDAEPRLLFIGRIGDVCWSAIATYRGETVRLISVRRSRPREVQAYEGE
ncbi:MAG: BrnT family toxin [Actinomycetota bacterium]|nr:BrnT family toxin [Actinomycetota bacterium]